MAATVCSDFGGNSVSGDLENKTKTRKFTIRNASDEDDAFNALVTHMTGLGIYPVNSLLQLATYSLEQLPDATGRIFKATVTWNSTPRLKPGDVRIHVSGSGGTVKMTHDLNTVQVLGDLTIAELAGAINVSQDGEPQGVDVYVPADSMTIERGLPSGTLTMAYIASLRSIRGRVNGFTWNGFAPGEVLFTDYDASSGNTEVDRISYKFELEPNVTSYQTAGFTFTEKQGHDYVSIGTAVKYDKTKKIKYPVARWGAIHQVYLRGNFAAVLGF